MRLFRQTGQETVSIHALLAECDQFDKVRKSAKVVSIHALLAECDQYLFDLALSLSCFNPRTPCGVRRMCGFLSEEALMFQSTHSLRSATMELLSKGSVEIVSIHALLAECDG